MGALILLMLCFYAFIAWAPQQVQQMFLAASWAFGMLIFVLVMLYYLGRFLLT